MRATLAVMSGVGAAIAIPARAYSDVRVFTQTYEYSTQPEDTTSVQVWHAQGRTEWNGADTEHYQGALEIEHGVGEHVDVGFRTYLDQRAPGALRFDEVQLVARARIGERADYPVDALVMAEAGKRFTESAYPLALRVVLARDFDRLLFVGNASLETSVGASVDDVDLSVGWAAGVSVGVHTAVRIGAEAWGQLDAPRHATGGPVVHLFPSSRLWLAITSGFQIVDAPEVVTVRAILGLEL